MSNYDAVFFDLDGTLWNNLECSTYILEVILPHIMERLEETDRKKIFNAFNASFIEMLREYGIHSQRSLSKVKRFELLLKHYGIDDPAFAQEMANKYSAAWRLYMRNFIKRDAFHVLQELQNRDLVLGIITNGVPIIQRQVIEGLGLDGFFKHVVISGLLGFQKPDRRIFEYAIRESGCRPGRILYIGDNPLVDIVGARRAGIKSAWIFSSRQPLTREMIMPDFVVYELSQLLPIVDQEQPQDAEPDV